MGTLEEHAKKMDIYGMITTAMITALTLVVGLFWNDAIKSAIDSLIPESQKIPAKFLAAIMLTVIVVLVIFLLIKSEEMSERHRKKLVSETNKFKRRIEQQRSMIEKQKKLLRKKIKKGLG
jgi:hypothetical protein